MSQDSTFDVIVVGAGLSGLLAAGALRAKGARVVVLDKGRGVGGRLARRRSDQVAFDHGAQYFTARSPQFRQLVDAWRDTGVVRAWAHGFALPDGSIKENEEPRYCGVSGMTTIPKHLAQGIDVRLKAKVCQLSHGNKRWSVSTESGDTFMGRALLLTPPVPQSLALLATEKVSLPPKVKADLERIVYAPCLALMVQLAGASRIPEPGGLWGAGEPIAWMADNQRKGVSPGPGAAITIHAGPRFSQTHWATPEAEVTTLLLEAAEPWLGSAPEQTQLHRWRYALPTTTHAERCLVLHEPAPLVFAGDAFGGPRVEGAALSGMAASEALLNLLEQPNGL